jgi:hypothetical protein
MSLLMIRCQRTGQEVRTGRLILTASEKFQTICSTPRAPTMGLTKLGGVMGLAGRRPGAANDNGLVAGRGTSA